MLSYAHHSGGGVQLESLTTAAFLANVTGRELIVPPWLVRGQMSKVHWDPHKVVRRSCGPGHISSAKQYLQRLSDKQFCTRCAKHQNALKLDSLLQVFNIRAVARARRRGCADCPLCQSMHLDTHLLLRPRNSSLRQPRVNCSQVAVDLRSPASCRQLLTSISEGASAMKTLCLGPLNDWFAESPHGHAGTILARCAATYPLAARLDHAGLPLRPEVLVGFARAIGSWDPSPWASCSTCIFARLPDDSGNTSRALALSALIRRNKHRLAIQISRGGSKRDRRGSSRLKLQGSRERYVEVVSSCHPLASCMAAVQTELPTVQLRPVAGTTNAMSVVGEVTQEPAKRLGLALGLSAENGRLLYDQLRCARCDALVAADGRSASSTFFHAIRRLHAALHSIQQT